MNKENVLIDADKLNSKMIKTRCPVKNTEIRKTKNKVLFEINPKEILIPNHFSIILETFISLDTVVNMLIKKRDSLYFDRISQVLKEMNKKEFDKLIFGQILTVFPESYSYEFDKPPLKITRHSKERLKLIPNLVFGSQSDCLTKNVKCFSLNQLLFRKNFLNDQLFNIVSEKHKEFLKNKDIPQDSFMSPPWHVEFDIEHFVDQIKPKPLENSNITACSPMKGKSKPFENRPSKEIIKVQELSSKRSSVNSTIASTKLSQSKSKDFDERKPLETSNKARQSGTDTTLRKSWNSSVKISPKKSCSKLSEKIEPMGLNTLRKSIITENTYQKDTFNNSVKTTPINAKGFETPEKCYSPRNTSGSTKLLKSDRSLNASKSLNQSRLSFMPTSSPRPNLKVNQEPKPVEATQEPRYYEKQKLPFHLKTLLELFVGLDKVVYRYNSKGQSCFLSKIASSVSMKNTFSEIHIAKIMKLYPEAYLVRWEPAPNARFTTPGKKFDLLIRPNLINDGTKSGVVSPSKSLMNFNFVRLKERSQIFFNRCREVVVSSYSKFLTEKLHIPPESLNQHINERPWSKDFKIDLDVNYVDPIELPKKPEKKEAVNISQIFNIVKQRNSVACNIKPKNESSANCNNKYKSISQNLLDKVRENEMKNSLLCKTESPEEKRRMIISKLPEFVTILDNEFKEELYKPLEKSYLIEVISESMSISKSSFNEYYGVLKELIPDWIEDLKWSKPYMSIGKSKITVDEIQEKLKTTISCQRI